MSYDEQDRLGALLAAHREAAAANKSAWNAFREAALEIRVRLGVSEVTAKCNLSGYALCYRLPLPTDTDGPGTSARLGEIHPAEGEQLKMFDGAWRLAAQRARAAAQDLCEELAQLTGAEWKLP